MKIAKMTMENEDLAEFRGCVVTADNGRLYIDIGELKKISETAEEKFFCTVLEIIAKDPTMAKQAKSSFFHNQIQLHLLSNVL